MLGAAMASGSQSQAFSTGGHFDDIDEAPSLYAGYVGGPLWGNVVTTFDAFQDHVARVVPLGIYTDYDNARTDGHSVSVRCAAAATSSSAAW